MDNEQIKSIYYELLGYLSSSPDDEKNSIVFDDESIWNLFNSAVERLNEITGKDYNKFRIDPVLREDGYQFVRVQKFKIHAGGLVSKIHAEYLFDEPAPLAKTPTTIINQGQTQIQETNLKMVLDVQSKIDEKMPKYIEGTKERTFLEKVKSELQSVKNIADLIALILKTGEGIGISTQQIIDLFR